MKTQVPTLVGAGVGGGPRHFPLGATPWRSSLLSIGGGSCGLVALSSARRERSLVAGVEVRAVALEISCVLCWLWLLGRHSYRLGWFAASGSVWKSERRLRKSSATMVLCCSVVSGHLGGRVVGSVGAQSQDWCVRVSQLYRFSASFPYKLVNSLLLYEEAELLPVARKKKIEQVARQTHL